LGENKIYNTDIIIELTKPRKCLIMITIVIKYSY
jgi:hypothetical protein